MVVYGSASTAPVFPFWLLLLVAVKVGLQAYWGQYTERARGKTRK
jgi:hypothetical protein